jgi:hypothetical protein
MRKGVVKMKKCIECKELKQTITKRSLLCKECFEALLQVKITKG